MVRTFNRDIASLNNIFEFVESVLATYQCSESIVFSVNLAVEELFTNIVKYNQRSNSDLTITIENEGKRIKVELIDPDADEFDVRKSNNVDVTGRLEERKVGGLGLHLVKKIVDNLDYQYINGKSKITFTKNLEQNNV